MRIGRFAAPLCCKRPMVATNAFISPNNLGIMFAFRCAKCGSVTTLPYDELFDITRGKE